MNNNIEQQSFNQQNYQQQPYQQQYQNGYTNPQNKAPKIILIIAIICILLCCCCGIGGGILALSNKDTDVESSVSNQENSSDLDIEDITQNENNTQVKTDNNTYHIGDEILVETDYGNYCLCITGVHETSDRNPYSDINADRVVVIDYRFENISYRTEYGELNVGDFDFSMYDADGNILSSYPADITYAKPVSEGHKSSGQMAFALNNSKNYIEAEYHDNMFMNSSLTIILEW